MNGAVTERHCPGLLLPVCLIAPADKGFGVGHTRETETKGIWLWGTPQPRKQQQQQQEAGGEVAAAGEGAAATAAAAGAGGDSMVRPWPVRSMDVAVKVPMWPRGCGCCGVLLW